MDLSVYLAFTAAEINAMQQHKGKTAWLGCQLSSYGSGITPCPPPLRQCSMLVLTDIAPPGGHDPAAVAEALCRQAEALTAERILLDFQRPPAEESIEILARTVRLAEIPVGAPPIYAAGSDCAVFLPSPPLWTPLQEAILPWESREIWLEIAPEDACVTLTDQGSQYQICEPVRAYPRTCRELCLTYHVQSCENALSVYLHRDTELIPSWLTQAKALGIRTAVGLYQQFSESKSLQSSDFMV